MDGKSPVEYLVDDAQRDAVRRVARALAPQPVRGSTQWRRLAPGDRIDERHPHPPASARRVWDSRGRPTVEAEVHAAPAAARPRHRAGRRRKGTREALELRDGGAAFGGLDVQRALAHVNGEIAAALVGLDADDQAALDAR